MLQQIQYHSSNDSRAQVETLRETHQQALQALAAHLQGAVLLPGTPDYEAARIIWNGTVDRRPALIVRCINANDVIAALTFARQQDMPVSVRSGAIVLLDTALTTVG